MQDSEAYRPTGFESVDDYATPDEFTAYLERINSFPALQMCKDRAIDLLDLSPGDRLIDVGCGTGYDIRMIRERADGVSIVGIDTSVEMLHAARLSLPSEAFQSGEVFLVRQDVSQLGFADGVFSASRADRVFQHLSDPERAIHEMRRVTQPGGKIVISDTYWGNLSIDGISEEASSALNEIYKHIIVNPSVVPEISRLLEKDGVDPRRIHEEHVPITFEGFSESDAVLWMEDSLQEGVKMGVIDEGVQSRSVESIRTTTPEDIRAHVDFYFISAVNQ